MFLIQLDHSKLIWTKTKIFQVLIQPDWNLSGMAGQTFKL